MSALDISPLREHRIDELGTLLTTEAVAERCWCMWFIVPYKQFHAEGSAGNRAAFAELAATDDHPLGLVATENTKIVGWCALGPRARYVRAIRTPTLADRTGDDDQTWFVPCLFVVPDHRGEGIAAALLNAAIDHATAAGAVAIEGFPLAGDRRRTSGSDVMTGNESLFASAGFEPHHRPSNARVIMRRTLDRTSS